MSQNSYDIWDVQSAASKLVGQAQTLSARHITDGMEHLQFNREVAYYARRIANDVELGNKTPEQGMQAILQEQRDLLNQSSALERNGQDAITDSVKQRAQSRLTQSVLRRDPERLLRFVHAQHLSATPTMPSAAKPAAPVSRTEYLKFFPRERWPEPIKLHDPGFYLVPKSTTASELEAQLFPSPNPAVIAKFRALNPDLAQIKAGQMIVLSDPNNPRSTHEEAKLMAAAEKVNAALQDLTPDEADFMTRHRDEIESFLKHGSTSMGAGLATFSSNLESVQSTLHNIEELHQRSFKRDGNLRSATFFAERKRLFTQLDTHLTSLTKKGIGFPDHPDLKSALGISSRSLVHRWTAAGGPGQIPGYATHINGVAKAAKYVKYGGWLSTAVGGGASYMKVQDVCAAGETEACKRVRFTESGSFLGSVGGGAIAGSYITGAVAGTICVGLGVPTAGVGSLLCSLVVVGAGSVGSGALAGKAGEFIGDFIYGVTK